MSSSVGTGLGSDSPFVLFPSLPAPETHDLHSSPVNFIRMIRAINATADLPPVGREHLKRKIADLFPPQRMFNKDIMELSLLHQELVDLLNH